MRLKHFFLNKIAHSSYIIAGQKFCAVIDPQRDTDIYVNEARALGVEITHIFQTHLHADFVSGHMDLAQKTGAKIYVSKSAGCTFDHIALSEGDTIGIEDMIFTVIETPGHTPEHVCYVVSDRTRGESPVCSFVGDTLFVGDVGRPDLFPDMAEELAGKLYHSLHDRLLKLPDYCEVYPAHGAGSLCGRAMGAKWSTTIGYERRYNSSLQITNKDRFITSLTQNMPPAPDHFSRCSDINRYGPKKISEMPVMDELSAGMFKKRIENPDIEILDTRSYHAYGSQHISRSWHLDMIGNFPTFAGWVLPFDKEILLVSDDYNSALETQLWARRVGIDKVTGYLDGGMSAWAMAGYKTGSTRQLSASDLHDMINGTSGFSCLMYVLRQNLRTTISKEP